MVECRKLAVVLVIYLIGAFATFGYESNRQPSAGDVAGRGNAASGLFAGILWPIYVPMRLSLKMWEPYWGTP